jgi:Fic family protein
MSEQIRQERDAYCDILEQTQKGTMDVTPWMLWFLSCLGRAIDGAQNVLATVLSKARFWERIQGIVLNERQTMILNRLLEDFEGKLTTFFPKRMARHTLGRYRSETQGCA